MNTHHRWLAALCLFWLTSLELRGCQYHRPLPPSTGHVSTQTVIVNLCRCAGSALPPAPPIH